MYWRHSGSTVFTKAHLGCALALSVLVASLPQDASAQTLNEGFAAMEQGDFFTAFSALRRLEQAGDPLAGELLERVFLTPRSVAVPERPASVGDYARPAAPDAARAAQQGAQSEAAPVPVALRPAARPAPEPDAASSLPLPPHPLPQPLREADFRSPDPALVRIGQLLFFDPILSGNKDTSCATCHHPRHASGDGVSLGIGTGALGLGPDRTALGEHAATQRIPRNAPALWNLGAREIRVLFHDGRLEVDPAHPGRLLSHQGPLDYMALDSLVAAQALFPMLSPEEMSGQPGENPIADAVAEARVHGDDGAWALIAARVDAIPDYRAAFEAWRGAARPVAIDEIANAIAAFIETEFRADETPFDLYLREIAALSPEAGEGMWLFYGRANCASCHSGPLLSDQGFHAMGQPPLGPGKERDSAGYTRDLGRGAVTLAPEDAYRFRTPMLRNVLHTGPWGHAGAFSDLRDFLRHHLDPVAGLAAYEPQAVLPELDAETDDYAALESAAQRAEIARAAARDMAQRPLVTLEEDEIGLLIAFLEALSDEGALAGRMGVPEVVPSGLEVAN